MKTISKKLVLIVYLFFWATLAYAGNIAEAKLNQLSLGMKPEQIMSILGQPEAIKSEGINAEGKTVEELKYSVTKRMGLSEKENDADQDITTYTCSLMIVNGVLVRIEKQPEKKTKPQDDTGDYRYMMGGASPS